MSKCMPICSIYSSKINAQGQSRDNRRNPVQSYPPSPIITHHATPPTPGQGSPTHSHPKLIIRRAGKMTAQLRGQGGQRTRYPPRRDPTPTPTTLGTVETRTTPQGQVRLRVGRMLSTSYAPYPSIRENVPPQIRKYEQEREEGRNPHKAPHTYLTLTVGTPPHKGMPTPHGPPQG